MPNASISEHDPADPPPWRTAGLRYHALGWHWRRRFGGRVWKVSLDGGFTCPNADGTVGTTGCRYCNIASFSPSRRGILDAAAGAATGVSTGSAVPRDLAVQFDEATRRIRARHAAARLVAYFQPATNTHAPVERLRTLYESALSLPGVVGLNIGTRPDCLGDDVLDLLAEFSRRTSLTLEIGLQSAHDHSLAWLRRGHDFACFKQAVERCAARGIPLGVHLIVGLPCETREQTLATAEIVARLPIAAVKLHNLHAVRDTRLAEEVAAGTATLPTLREYVSLAADVLERLSPAQVIDRLSGEAPAEYLVGPAWCADKAAVRLAIDAELARRDSWQGKSCGRGVERLP